MTAILFVTELQIWPANGGEKIQAYNVLNCLSQLFDVTVLAPLPPADCPLLAQVRGWTNLAGVPRSYKRRLLSSPAVLLPRPDWQDTLTRLIETIKPQIVWFNYGHWGQYADLVHRLGPAALMQTHNAQSQLQRQGLGSRPLTRWHVYYLLHYVLEGWHERHLFQRFERVLSVSEEDRLYHARFVQPDRCLRMPNFINEDLYSLDGVERQAGRVVMTGNFGTFQNQAGARWFVDAVWPRVRQEIPAARLVLAGGAPGTWRELFAADPTITCTGSVPAVAPFLRQAEVAVAPLLHGSGTRFKILEALACETALVSTSQGAEGVGLVDGVHCRLADTPADFARAVIKLLQDQALREQLAASGLSLVKREFGFSPNRDRLREIAVHLIEECLNEKI